MWTDAYEQGWKDGYGFFGNSLRGIQTSNPYEYNTTNWHEYEHGYKHGYQERWEERAE